MFPTMFLTICFAKILNDPDFFGETAVYISCPYGKRLSSKIKKILRAVFVKKRKTAYQVNVSGVILWDLLRRSRDPKTNIIFNLTNLYPYHYSL